MPTDWIVYACLLLGLSSALVGGVFQAFSDFVMRGLLLAQPAGGIDSMQQINRTVLRSEFIVSLLALAPLSVGFAIFGWLQLDGLARNLIVAAGVVYSLTVFFVTIAGNVPMNRRLDSLSANSPEAAGYWRVYGLRWTRLNHLRTVGSITTAGLYLVAMLNLA